MWWVFCAMGGDLGDGACHLGSDEWSARRLGELEEWPDAVDVYFETPSGGQRRCGSTVGVFVQLLLAGDRATAWLQLKDGHGDRFARNGDFPMRLPMGRHSAGRLGYRGHGAEGIETDRRCIRVSPCSRIATAHGDVGGAWGGMKHST